MRRHDLKRDIEARYGNLVSEMARLAAHAPEEEIEQMEKKIAMLDRAASYLYAKPKPVDEAIAQPAGVKPGITTDNIEENYGNLIAQVIELSKVVACPKQKAELLVKIMPYLYGRLENVAVKHDVDQGLMEAMMAIHERNQNTSGENTK